MKKKIYFVGGLFALVLAFFGAILPLVPTTPFLLLSAWFFARSSMKFYNWLITNRLFGKYLNDYKAKRGIPLKIKIGSVAFMWASVISSFILFRDHLVVIITIPLISIAVTVHILRFKTRKD